MPLDYIIGIYYDLIILTGAGAQMANVLGSCHLPYPSEWTSPTLRVKYSQLDTTPLDPQFGGSIIREYNISISAISLYY